MVQEKIEKTSDQVSFARYVLTEHYNLLEDPLAKSYYSHLSNSDLNEAVRQETHYKTVEEAKEVFAYVKARTDFVNSELLSALKNGCLQVVILGAGRTPLPIMFPQFKNVKYYEIDFRVETLEEKYQHIEKLGLDDIRLENHKFIGMKLPGKPGELSDSLKNHDFDRTKKTVWIIEGLLHYLSDQESKNLFAEIEKNLTPNCVLIGDHLNRNSYRFLKLLQFPVIGKWLRKLASHVSDEMLHHFQYGANSYESMLHTQKKVKLQRVAFNRFLGPKKAFQSVHAKDVSKFAETIFPGGHFFKYTIKKALQTRGF